LRCRNFRGSSSQDAPLFRPRGFSPPRRFTPSRPCWFVAPSYRPWGSPRFVQLRNYTPRDAVLPSEALLSTRSDDGADCSKPPGWRHPDVFPFRDVGFTANLALSSFLRRRSPRCPAYAGPRLDRSEAGTSGLCSTGRAVPPFQVALLRWPLLPWACLFLRGSLSPFHPFAAEPVARKGVTRAPPRGAGRAGSRRASRQAETSRREPREGGSGDPIAP